VRIGLLQCDHVRDELLPISGDYDAMFARWLPAEWRVYDLTRGETPGRLDECEAYIATGSKASVYDDVRWIRRYAQLVREIHAVRVPYLGVCFGHQMIAHALGGRVARSPRGWSIGVHTIPITLKEAWMNPPLDNVSVLMSCQDQVERLPEGAVVLAGGDHCPAGIIRVDSLLGIQGHPEWTPAYAEALMKTRADQIGKDHVDRARLTLANPASSEVIAGWIRHWARIAPVKPV
jgi:GMP synthase-like glutamine amidotransferase